MPKVLLTGGSGFIATHILELLLRRGYNVFITVRSQAKGEKILSRYAVSPARKRVSYIVVEDVAKEGAFDQAVQHDPPLEFVIHTASPFHDQFKDPVEEMFNPTINGTRGILKSIQAYSPLTKRVIITSSFAAMVQEDSPPDVYDEASWNPTTWDEALARRSKIYRGAKTFAEKAAWQFVQTERPNFDLVTMNPPLVYGPVAHEIGNLARLNTSNQRIRDLIQGKYVEDELPHTGTFFWVDVRDLAYAHVRALEVDEAGNKRVFVTAGNCSNKRIVDAIRDTHPQLAPFLPENPADDFHQQGWHYDNSRATQLLGVKFRPLVDCIGDTVDSLLRIKD